MLNTIQMLQWLKRIRGIVQDVCRSSCYLIADKHLLQEFIFIFRYISLCHLWLFMSPYIYIIVSNCSAVVGMYTVTCLNGMEHR
jgi:hypothetical protein